MADPAGMNATPTEVGAEAVRAELDRIVASTVFRRAVRLRTLLRYLVTEALREPDLVLKEYHIGIEIFGKPDSFDPRSDPIVRVEAGRLRLKLKSYYAVEGASDPVEIAVPVGTYAPVFRHRAVPDTPNAASTADRGTGRAVAILPFKAMVNSRDELLASALAKQTAHAVSTCRNVRVLAWHSVLSISNRKSQPIAAADVELGAVLDGSVWRRRNTLSASIELVHVPDGRLLWSHIYERAGNIDFELLRELAETIAADLVLPAEFGAADSSRRVVAAIR